MNAADLFKAINKQFDLNKMVPVTIVEKSIMDRYATSPSELLKICEELHCSIYDLYYMPDNILHPFCYYKDYLYLSLPVVNMEMMRHVGLNFDTYRQQIDRMKKLRENKDFQLYFFFMEKPVRFKAFLDLYAEIPDDMKFDVFTELYRHGEYGFSAFKPELIRDALRFRHLSKEFVPLREELTEHVDKNGYLSIYRGQGDESTPIDQAYSWTLKYDTAYFFATRFSSRGAIYHARVHVDDIIWYMPDRNEEEVLVFHDTLKDVERVYAPIQYKLKDLTDMLEEKYYLGVYQRNLDKLDPALFHNPSGIHGINHCKRVLFLSCTLAMLEALGPMDTTILAHAAVYHDIGRVHDSEDELHGYESIKKMKRLRLYAEPPTGTQQEDKAIFKFLVENHCIDDEKALEGMAAYSIHDVERAGRLLKIFKDADGLDRVRLGDLDARYLRTKHAVQLMAAAVELLQLDTEYAAG